MIQRELTADEIDAFLIRHEDIYSRVLQHNRLFDGTGQWDQIRMNESAYPNMPVPAKGLAVNDEVFGVVVIFPDASGHLHYSGNVRSDILQSDITKAPYQSPSGNVLETILKDISKGLGQAVITGLIVWFIVNRLLSAAGV